MHFSHGRVVYLPCYLSQSGPKTRSVLRNCTAILIISFGLSLSLGLGISLSPPVSAAANAARVDLPVRLAEISGRVVQVLPDGSQLPVLVGAELTPGVTIRAEAGASASLVIDEGLRIRLEENSRLRVNTASREEVPGHTSGASSPPGVTCVRVGVTVDAGRAFFNLDGSREAYLDFRISTAPAAIVVRGTALSVAVADGGQTVVSVNRGGAEVLAAGASIFVPEQFQSLVRPGQPPSTPMALSEAEEREWTRVSGWLTPGG